MTQSRVQVGHLPNIVHCSLRTNTNQHTVISSALNVLRRRLFNLKVSSRLDICFNVNCGNNHVFRQSLIFIVLVSLILTRWHYDGRPSSTQCFRVESLYNAMPYHKFSNNSAQKNVGPKHMCAKPKWVQFCSSLIHASMINRKPNSTICVCQAWPTSQCPSMPAPINHYSWWGSKTKKCRKTFERRSTTTEWADMQKTHNTRFSVKQQYREGGGQHCKCAAVM